MNDADVLAVLSGPMTLGEVARALAGAGHLADAGMALAHRLAKLVRRGVVRRYYRPGQVMAVYERTEVAVSCLPLRAPRSELGGGAA